MLVLIGIGLVAGIVTALSPCVLPVLPILLAGSAAGGRRRPYAIIGGLVASFTVFTLTASWLLDLLGLPQDFLRNAAIAMLFALAAILVVPQIGDLVSRPLSRVARRPRGDLGGGFLLGASLGLVFVPCAGPVLAAVTVVAATQEVGVRAFALTLAYAVGAAVPMLLVAAGGQRLLRPFAPRLRQAFGVVIFATALAIALGLDRPFQTALPGYTEALQSRVEQSEAAERELRKVTRVGESGTGSQARVTPETPLGWQRLRAYAGDDVERGVRKRYRLAEDVPRDHVSYGGEWTVGRERIVAGDGARLKLRFRARDVHLVLDGRGTVEALVDGAPAGVTRVTEPGRYTLLRLPQAAEGELELRFSPGVAGRVFTFG